MIFYRLLFIFLCNVLVFSQDLEDLSFGDDSSLDIATWNIEWFPKNGQTTAEYVGQILYQLDLDVLAMQELDDKTAFDQMVSELSNYTGYYESAWFAGLAYIYKSDVVQINSIYEIYTTSPYWSAFPRSPMVMDMNFMGENYIIINNHLKCCGNDYLDLNDTGDEETRRYIASSLLKEYVDNNFSESNVIVLGDLNDSLSDNLANNVFQMIIDDSENYLFTDMDIAYSNPTMWSYPSWPSHLDHILITNELFDNNSYTDVIRIDNFMDGEFNEYDQYISDHRPVAIKLTSNVNNFGDINFDGQIDITDIVLLVNIILSESNDYDISADLNQDGFINIVDIVLLVDIILN